ncbi:MAG TPA: hypothetical protein P5287_04325, partial [bacterium]|nr:hypothetical protein [bacterium]
RDYPPVQALVKAGVVTFGVSKSEAFAPGSVAQILNEFAQAPDAAPDAAAMRAYREAVGRDDMGIFSPDVIEAAVRDADHARIGRMIRQAKHEVNNKMIGVVYIDFVNEDLRDRPVPGLEAESAELAGLHKSAMELNRRINEFRQETPTRESALRALDDACADYPLLAGAIRRIVDLSGAIAAAIPPDGGERASLKENLAKVRKADVAVRLIEGFLLEARRERERLIAAAPDGAGNAIPSWKLRHDLNNKLARLVAADILPLSWRPLTNAAYERVAQEQMALMGSLLNKIVREQKEAAALALPSRSAPDAGAAVAALRSRYSSMIEDARAISAAAAALIRLQQDDGVPDPRLAGMLDGIAAAAAESETLADAFFAALSAECGVAVPPGGTLLPAEPVSPAVDPAA